jgi:hypothetical protein
MTTTKTPLSELATHRRWQTNFLSVLPAVYHHARISFRRLRGDIRSEAIAATIARAFVDYGILARRRKLARAYPCSLGEFAVRRIRAGRVVGSPQNTRDLFNRDPQRRSIRSLTPCDSSGTWREVVLEDRRVTPADQACFNLDFQAWLAQWPPRHRAIINTLGAGHRNHEVAVRFKTSRSCISKFRRTYRESWDQFQNVSQAA